MFIMFFSERLCLCDIITRGVVTILLFPGEVRGKSIGPHADPEFSVQYCHLLVTAWQSCRRALRSLDNALPSWLAVDYYCFLLPRGCASLAGHLPCPAALLGNWLDRTGQGPSGSQLWPRFFRPSSTSQATTQGKVCEDQAAIFKNPPHPSEGEREGSGMCKISLREF